MGVSGRVAPYRALESPRMYSESFVPVTGYTYLVRVNPYSQLVQPCLDSSVTIGTY